MKNLRSLLALLCLGLLFVGLSGCGESAGERPPEARATPQLLEGSAAAVETNTSQSAIQHGTPDGHVEPAAPAAAAPVVGSYPPAPAAHVAPATLVASASPAASPACCASPGASGSPGCCASPGAHASAAAGHGCSCSINKKECACGHCSGVIGECHCRH